MGGLRKHTPITFWTLMCAGVAIAGVPPFSGFHSKDAILAATYQHAPWMYWVGVFTAGMTAFYVFRALFLCFFGEYRGHHHPHESPFVMWGPLVVLAGLSLGIIVLLSAASIATSTGMPSGPSCFSGFSEPRSPRPLSGGIFPAAAKAGSARSFEATCA